MSQEGQNQNSTSKLVNLLRESSGQKTFDNIQKILSGDKITIGEKSWKIAMLKPRQLMEIQKLQNQREELKAEDVEKADDLLFNSAEILLEDFKREDYNDIDAVKLQIAITALVVRANGFCDF